MGPPVGILPPYYLTFLSSSCTRPLTTGPRCRSPSPVSRAEPCRPRPTALPCSPARLHHEHALPLLTAPPRAIPTPRPSLSPIFLPPRGTEPPPPISLSCSPSRTRRFGEVTGASLRSILCPHSSLSSPPSPPPTCQPHRLPPPGTPPLWFPPEHHRHPPLSVSTTARSLSVQMDSPLTFSLLPQHCWATPSTSSVTGVVSPPLNTTA
jgi:hypothetical protein